MPSLCHHLSSHYAHLRTLTDAFTTEYERVKETGDLTEVRKMKIKLEEARESLLEQLCIFRVPDAINPYHKALLTAGLDTKKTRERKEMIVDIREEIQRQLERYREVLDSNNKPFLQAWMDDITKNEAFLYAEIVKNRSKIVERIKVGMIPIVMPGRSVQERTWKVALSNLNPIWFKDGAKRTVVDAHVDNVYDKEKMNHAGFFKDIPDRPYLVWVVPTVDPNDLTFTRTFEDQQTYYAKLVTEHPDLYDRTDLIPTEYSALQAIFTSAIKKRYQEMQGVTSEPTYIRPFDGSTYTRFLSVELFFNGFVPSAYFDPDNRRVHFSSDGSDEGVMSGFRPASRT